VTRAGIAFLAGLAWLALGIAPGPAFAAPPPVPISLEPSVVIKGTCSNPYCSVVVQATRITGPTAKCRVRRRNTPQILMTTDPVSFNSTSFTCRVYDPEFFSISPPTAGVWDLTLSNDNVDYSSTSLELVLECPEGRFGEFCQDCSANCDIDQGICNDGWEGDGLCTECFLGFWGAECFNYCACPAGPPFNIWPCDQATGVCKGDWDDDGDVDLADYFAGFYACLISPPPSTTCLQRFDADNDGDIDLRDFAGFQVWFRG